MVATDTANYRGEVPSVFRNAVIEYFNEANTLECSGCTYEELLEWIEENRAEWEALRELALADCDHMEIRLPDYLEVFNCTGSRFTSLPVLPLTLTVLDCPENKLESLPYLHSGITYVDCSYNRIENLPPLPDTLQSLYCYGNRLESLPNLDQTRLIFLNCGGNSLTSLPVLPNTLEELYSDENPIEAMTLFPQALHLVNGHIID